jgi:hypothetical protein
MAFDQKKNSDAEALPNKEPQAPQSVPMAIVENDESIGRNNIPYNPGGEGHGTRCTVS